MAVVVAGDDRSCTRSPSLTVTMKDVAVTRREFAREYSVADESFS